MAQKSPDLSALARPGATLDVRVTPKAARDRIWYDEAGRLRVGVTAAPENGKATAAVIKLLARALGVPKSKLVLIRGATARDKSFRVEP